MPLEDGVYNRLSNHSGLSALVGSGASSRVYPNKTPDKPTTPYVVFELDDDDEAESEHAMGADIDSRRARGRFWCFATTGDAARDVATEVLAALSRYRGLNAGVTFEDCYRLGNRPIVEDETKLIGRLVEFEVVYRE